MLSFINVAARVSVFKVPVGFKVTAIKKSHEKINHTTMIVFNFFIVLLNGFDQGPYLLPQFFISIPKT